MIKIKTRITLILLFSINRLVMSQEFAAEPQRMNTIKIEYTRALYPNSFVVSYERVTKPNQSFGVSFGYEEFPGFTNASSTVHVREDLNKGGYKAGAEYRFYLRKENKFDAPRGVYIGPYFSYHSFFNKRQIEVFVNGTTESAELRADFNILNIGFEVGYQFVINNRWTIDLVIIGPSVSNYKAELGLDGNFTFDKEEVENEVLLALLNRFPLLDNLLTDKKVSSEGRLDSWSMGWRYSFLIGYHFGRKKK